MMRLKTFLLPSATKQRSGISSVMALVLIAVIIAAMGVGVAGALIVARTANGERALERRDDYVLIPFGTVVVNLKGERLGRFLQTTIALKVDRAHAQEVREFLGERRVVFQHWLITRLSDKHIQDVEGTAAMRTLQREITDGFNAILREHGKTIEIENILFEDFNVQ